MDVPKSIPVKWQYAGGFRRFRIEATYERTLYEDLIDKATRVAKTGNAFYLAWEDEEGDKILIACDFELEEAWSHQKDGILRIVTIDVQEREQRLEIENPMEDELPSHGNVQCDKCNCFVVGIRYKCIMCPDFDLCQTCEKAGSHAIHGMLRIVDPDRTHIPWGTRINYSGVMPGRHKFGSRNIFDSGNSKYEETLGSTKSVKEECDIKDHMSKGIQYLTEIGQQVTSALSNLGIDVTYEVKNIMKQKSNGKTRRNTTQMECRENLDDIKTYSPYYSTVKNEMETDLKSQSSSHKYSTAFSKLEATHMENEAQEEQNAEFSNLVENKFGYDKEEIPNKKMLDVEIDIVKRAQAVDNAKTEKLTMSKVDSYDSLDSDCEIVSHPYSASNEYVNINGSVQDLNYIRELLTHNSIPTMQRQDCMGDNDEKFNQGEIIGEVPSLEKTRTVELNLQSDSADILMQPAGEETVNKLLEMGFARDAVIQVIVKHGLILEKCLNELTTFNS